MYGLKIISKNMKVKHKDKTYFLFYGGIFSNWTTSPFTINGIEYSCGEQYMMHQKAMVFKDQESADKIMATPLPHEQKKLGRKVKNYNDNTWRVVRYPLVKVGLKQKFLQNPEMLEFLIDNKDCQIVETSKHDAIWGVGFDRYTAIQNIDKWGQNLLGQMLTELANELYEKTK